MKPLKSLSLMSQRKTAEYGNVLREVLPGERMEPLDGLLENMSSFVTRLIGKTENQVREVGFSVHRTEIKMGLNSELAPMDLNKLIWKKPEFEVSLTFTDGKNIFSIEGIPDSERIERVFVHAHYCHIILKNKKGSRTSIILDTLQTPSEAVRFRPEMFVKGLNARHTETDLLEVILLRSELGKKIMDRLKATYPKLSQKELFKKIKKIASTPSESFDS